MRDNEARKKLEQSEIPFKISFRDFPESDAVWMAVQNSIDKLTPYTRTMRILSCDVVLSKPHRHGNKGSIYHVEIRLHIPGGYIIIDREPEKDHSHEDIYVAIRDAFDALDRKLDAKIQKKRGYVKNHERSLNAVKEIDEFES